MVKNRLPEAKIIAAQSELRYYKGDNPWNAPEAEEFFYRRNAFNNFLRRCKTKDAIMQISGKGRMDSQEYYADEVNLNNVGLNKYFDIIKNCIANHYTQDYQ